jgi:hypothetical protein
LSGNDRKIDAEVASENGERESIWAIRPRWTTLYFVLFTLQVVVGFGIATYDGLSSTNVDAWTETYFDIIIRTGQVGIAAAVITFTLIELLGSIMLMSEWIRVNLVEPAKERRREEGREEGREEAIVAFRDWYRRQQSAFSRGEPFDDPPPFMRNGHSDD